MRVAEYAGEDLRSRPPQSRHSSRNAVSGIIFGRRQLNGFKFRRQHAIGSYVCDFVCLEASVVIELDGSQHLAQAPYDAQRDAFLRSKGFRVLRFWNGSVLVETDAVVQTVMEALSRREMDGRFE